MLLVSQFLNKTCQAKTGVSRFSVCSSTFSLCISDSWKLRTFSLFYAILSASFLWSVVFIIRQQKEVILPIPEHFNLTCFLSSLSTCHFIFGILIPTTKHINNELIFHNMPLKLHVYAQTPKHLLVRNNISGTWSDISHPEISPCKRHHCLLSVSCLIFVSSKSVDIGNKRQLWNFSKYYRNVKCCKY